MTGGKSSYLANALLDHALGGAEYERPETVWVALHTADPTDAGTGDEVSGGGYVRAALANDEISWSTAFMGEKSNQVQVVFPTATEDWGTVTHFGLWDAAEGGNLLYHGSLATAQTISTGTNALFRMGAITVTED